MIAFGPTPRRRRPSLTPMIDVVFLLLVFFMLTARFSQETAIPLSLSGAGSDWSGPPRLVDILPGELRLNGLPVDARELAARLAPLMADRDDPVLLRPRDGADLQDLVTVMDALRAEGMTGFVLVEEQ